MSTGFYSIHAALSNSLYYKELRRGRRGLSFKNRRRYTFYIDFRLHLKGYDVKLGSDFCFNPAHDNKNTRAAKYSEDKFTCYSGNCGIHGDIYDAVGILEGITDKAEQYLFLEKLFGGENWQSSSAIQTKKKKEFIRDPVAETELENYLKRNHSQKEVEKFLNMRALALSLGTIKSYPADLMPSMIKHFYCWPGLKRALADLGFDILKRSGVSLDNPKNGKESWWTPPGVVLKLGNGFKLPEVWPKSIPTTL